MNIFLKDGLNPQFCLNVRDILHKSILKIVVKTW